MSLNFPDAPSDGQVYTPFAGTSYTYNTPVWKLNANTISDGDKGDVVISGSGSTFMLDTAVVTTAAKTVLDDASTAAMLTTLGGVEEAPNDTNIYARADLGWVEIPGIGGLSPTEYNYNASLYVPPPNTGNLRLNNVSQTAATAIYFNHINIVNVDVSKALRMLMPGNKILMQDKTNAANYQVYEVSATITDFAAYTTVPVIWMNGGSNCSAGRVMIAAFGLGATAGVEEAPIDGQEYVRKDADWTVSSGGSGTGTVTIINSGSFFSTEVR